jgi:hypothetical protein
VIGYGRYKLSIGTHYMYVDYRDADFGLNLLGYNGEDMQFKYNNGFSYYVSGRAINDGTTVTIWGYFGKEDPIRIPVTVKDNLNGAFGGMVTIDGSAHLYPYQSLWTRGSHSVTASAQQGPNWVFDHWSDGGARSHTVTVDETNFALVLTATYIQNPRRLLQPSSLGITSSVYPNPFNPTTVIEYCLPYRAHVSLVVVDMFGRKVAALVGGDVEAGSHQAQFNASNLASGVYFYRLQVGAFTQVRAMAVVR